VAPIDVASAYLHAAENEHALDWLARSVDVRDPNAFGIAADPQITDKLGADPRLAELLRRMALPAARLE